ncbi:MAG: hypothetical protein AAGJ40_23680 [Planctomycetota bacterium]
MNQVLSVGLHSIQRILFLSFLCQVLSAKSSFAEVVFDDGGFNVVNTAIDDFIRVSDSSSGTPTSVIFEAGANIMGDSFGDSIRVRDRSMISVFDGTFAEDVTALDSSVMEISGGQFLDDVFAFDDSLVLVSGGSIADDLTAVGNSNVIMTGGSVGEDVEVSGASIRVVGGAFATSGMGGLALGDGGEIVLVGSNFLLNGAPIGFGEITDFSGLLSGTLSDGSMFSDIPFRRNFGNPMMPGTLSVTAIPEPTAFWLMTFIAVGSTVLFRRRRASFPNRPV